MSLGVLKDSDDVINSNGRSAAKASSEFKPFILYMTTFNKPNISLCMAQLNISLRVWQLALKLQSACLLVMSELTITVSYITPLI